jgi:hypothetical protein
MSAKEVFSRADVQWLVEIAAELEPKDVSLLLRLSWWRSAGG